MQIRIAFDFKGGSEWQAGVSWLKALSYALRQNYGDDALLFFLPHEKRKKNDFSPAEVEEESFQIPNPPKLSPLWGFSQITRCIIGNDLLKAHYLKRSKIDAYFGLVVENRIGNIPILSWIPDFQHIRLPEMFAESERRFRDRAFMKSAMVSDRVILMSEAVKKDFLAFAPEFVAKARVVKTCSFIPEYIYELNPRNVIEKYNLPEKFFYIPNQFWKHKNHEVVFEALKIIKENGKRVFVVCSGYKVDYRHPNYFSYLLQKLSESGISNQVYLLGLIPRDDVFILMRQAICVLNPSLFEGFGLTVDEARSVGKRALLSDILAHREQNPPKAVFFNPRDCEDLVRKMEKIWNESLPGPDLELELEARQSLFERVKKSAESFMSIIKELVR